MLSRISGTMIGAVALLVAALTSVASAADVFIQSDLSGGFARMQRGSLHANGAPDQAMRFELVRLRGDRVAFRAPDGSYLRAGVGPETRLATGSPHIRGWETFEMVRFGSTSALRSVQNGLFVEVDQRSGRLSATASRFTTRAAINVIGAPSRGQGAANNPRVEWTGRWSQMWVASPNGNMHRPPQGSRARFTISDRRDVEMTAGCNTISARLSVDGRRVRFDNVTMTRMRCSNAQQGYEQGMARALEGARSYDFREGQVAFLDARGRTLFQIAR